jgi:apolipoprotein N-acyltransferase
MTATETTGDARATRRFHDSGPQAVDPPAAPQDRLSWVWLLLGAALLPVSNLQTLVPVAAWVAPVFLMRFTRGQRARVGLPVLIVVMSGAALIGLRGGFFPVASGLDYVLFVAGLGVGGALPYALDRLVARRSGPWIRTLTFPLAATSIEFLATFGNAFGTAGSTAYSQYSSLTLVQLASLTGIWGLTFLVSWLAPVVNEVWEARTRPRPPSGGNAGSGVRGVVATFCVAILGVSLFGGARIAFAAPDHATVRVAALAPDRDLSIAAFSAPRLRPDQPTQRPAVSAERFAPLLDDLFARSEAEAKAGAKIVVWSEAAALVLVEDQQAVVRRAAELAAREGVYFQIAMIVLLNTDGSDGGTSNENHAVLLGPDGDVVWDYLKSKPTPGDGHTAGPGILPTVDTPYGRLSTVICQDDFFPGLLRQAGQADVDILLAPSSDWPSVAAWHAQQSSFRAVESGVSIVRPTRQGISLATDAQGRLIGHKADYEVADGQTLVTSVPTRGEDTVYTVVGEFFAYLSLLLLLAILGRHAVSALARRRGSNHG